MKELRDFTHRRTDKAFIARAVLKVCRDDELVKATDTLNKTAFSCRDIVHFHKILCRAEAA